MGRISFTGVEEGTDVISDVSEGMLDTKDTRRPGYCICVLEHGGMFDAVDARRPKDGRWKLVLKVTLGLDVAGADARRPTLDSHPVAGMASAFISGIRVFDRPKSIMIANVRKLSSEYSN